MRVVTRLSLGSGLLLALLVAAIVLQVAATRRLARATTTLAGVTFRAASTSLELARRVDRIDEYTRKLFATGDADYAAKVAEAEAAASATLRGLTALELSGPERDALARLQEAWLDLPLAADPANLLAAVGRPPEGRPLEAALAAVEQVRSEVRSLLEANQAAIAGQVDRSAAAARRATRVSLAMMATAVALSVVVVLLTVRSISVPLRRLTEGTRAVARGALDTHLDADGDDELARLAGDFNAMVHRLDELDRLKRDFVSHVSHELKTPLAAMQETTRLLLEEAPGPLTAKQRRLLELTLQAARRLATMIRNLLDLSRLEAGTMDYDRRPWPLGDLVRPAVAELEAWAAERGVGLDVEIEEPAAVVHCDRDKVMQVVQNLVDNAVKFSPAGSRVAVRARLRAPAPDEPHQAEVAVADRGPGIAPQERGRVFERFRQLAGGRGRGGAGVGLGLAISRQIVEAHGGGIGIADNPGGGTVVRFSIPAGDDRG